MRHLPLLRANPGLSSYIPASIARNNRIVPIMVLSHTLVVASDKPLSAEINEKLNFILNCKIKGVVRNENWITAELSHLYGKNNFIAENKLNEETSYSYSITCDKKFSDRVGTHTFHLKTSWVGQDEEGRVGFYDGDTEISSDHPDHELWKWIISHPYFEGIISDNEIPKIRRIWKRYLERTGKDIS